MDDEMKLKYGAECRLNGVYLKKQHGETYMFRDGYWIKYPYIFTHEDLISVIWL